MKMFWLLAFLSSSAFAGVNPTQVNIDDPSSGYQMAVNSDGSINVSCTGGGSGTVTSVNMTLPAWLMVSGNPITTSGTLAITGTSESANLFLASPNGSSGGVSPRAIVAADIPTLNQNTSGNAATVTTNANMTGPITGTGNVTSITAQTGTGTTFVMQASPTLTTPNIGTATGSASLDCLLSGCTMSGALDNTFAGTASTPAFFLSGTPFSGGNGTTTKPAFLIEDAATPFSSWNTSGSYFGVNSASAFAGDFLNINKNGSSRLVLTNGGALTVSSTIQGTQLTVGASGILSTGNNVPVILGSTRTFSTTDQVQLATSTNNGSTGTHAGVSILPIYNQTSSAGATDLLINRTETAVGSGTQRLIDAQVASTTKFNVDRTGAISAAGTTLTMASIGSVTPGTAACFSAGGVLGTDAANCIASLREYKQDFETMDPVEALNTVTALSDAARYYRYTDEFLGAAKIKPHARDRQPGFIAEQVEAIDPRYAAYNGDKLRGVRYEQMTATEAVAIKELKREIDELKADVLLLKAGI